MRRVALSSAGVRPDFATARRATTASRGAAAWFALLVAAVAPIGVEADDIELGLQQAITGQSNLFRSATTPIPDGNYEIMPIIRVDGAGGTYGYALEYRPSYEVYFDNENVNGFDQFFRGNVYFRPQPISTVRFAADVADYRSVRALTAAGPDGIPDIVPQTTGRILRSFLDLAYEHEITRSTTATAGLGFQSYEYSTPNNPDSLGFALEGSALHRITRDLAVGGSVLGSFRQFDQLDPQPASQNAVANANLLLLYEPMPSLFFEVSVGPAVVFTRQDDPGPQLVNRFIGATTIFGPTALAFQTDPTLGPSCQSVGGQFILLTCPPRPALLPPGSFNEQIYVGFDPGAVPTRNDQNVFTGFANLEVRWEDSWGEASIGYFRGEDASAGIGTTTIRDSVTAAIQVRTFWQIDLRIRGNWNQRQATGATNQFTTRAGPSPFPALPLPGGPALFVAQANGLIDTGVATETDITQYWADVLATREVYERVWLELGFRYLNQERVDKPGSVTTSFDNIIGSVMVRYMFAPIEF